MFQSNSMREKNIFNKPSWKRWIPIRKKKYGIIPYTKNESYIKKEVNNHISVEGGDKMPLCGNLWPKLKMFPEKN